jgi:hypothetical protein
MTKDEIKQRLEASPFLPFKVKVAGGGEFDVPSRDHAHLHPKGRVLTVFIEDGGTEIIDVALVSSIFIKEAA